MIISQIARNSCPHCGGTLTRVRRRPADRLLSLLVPVGRLHCDWATCQWEGTRVVNKVR
jgi:hypothetical protein